MNFLEVSRWICIHLTVLMLYGCYESDTAILEKGEYAPVLGVWQCTNQLSGSKKPYAISEKKEGLIFKNYEYTDQEGNIILFKKISSSLFLAQSPKGGGSFEYYYMDILNGGSFALMVADLLGKGDYIEQLLTKYKIHGTQKKELLSLKGDKAAIRDFLISHDKWLLTVVLKCDKQVASEAATLHEALPVIGRWRDVKDKDVVVEFYEDGTWTLSQPKLLAGGTYLLKGKKMHSEVTRTSDEKEYPTGTKLDEEILLDGDKLIVNGKMSSPSHNEIISYIEEFRRESKR